MAMSPKSNYRMDITNQVFALILIIILILLFWMVATQKPETGFPGQPDREKRTGWQEKEPAATESYGSLVWG